MSCGCKTSGDSSHSCGTKSANGCESVDTCGNSYKLSVFDWLSDINNPSQSQTDFVEVRFKNDRKFFYKNINKLPLHIGSIVTVESSPGHDIGVVSLTGELVKIQMKKKYVTEDNPLKIYRLANQKDIEVWQEVRAKEESVKVQGRKIAYALNLEMKITDVEFQGDGGKVTFYYTADNRVDFRQLIKEFASLFRTKIDMKQIGFRQEAAKVGGIGSCGRELCCSTWLTDFRSVNTNAARYQQLSINPQKLAGQCGKLKCCLNYELDSYLDALSDFPSSNSTIETEKGKAFCIKIDVFKKRMWFAYVDHSMSWYDLDVQDVKKLIAQNKKGEKAPPLEDLKTNDIPVKSVDLIQENNVDRFERRGRNPGKNQNKRKPNNQQNQQRGDRKPSENQTDVRNPVANKQAPQSAKPTQQQPKKFKKKTPPKRDDNA
ncbi:PSP1 domain-containing protein [Kaistella polysaccharea]|uniref:PSP1 domain-containing protein n=1 Tax=Kaistella polysaccharea TaxID=2878534 RepID=UPI001CF1418D|nr:regulatory iron-sulfur-containing complex subunit RicT [Kaistella polysaccharea]